MPIYDHNGSAASEIKYLYDNNGSVNTQIGKVYDNNGTTNSLIYAGDEIYPGATVSTLQVNFGSYGNFYTYIESNSSNINSTVQYISVNLTGISTLTITGSFYAHGGGSGSGVWLATWAQLQNCKYPYYVVGAGSSSSNYTLLYRQNAGTSSGTVTKTWNVSGYSGTYYLAIGAYNQLTGNAGATINSVKAN